MKRKRLSKSEKRDLAEKLKKFGFELKLKKENLERVKIENEKDVTIIYDLDSDKSICFWKNQNKEKIFPSLHLVNSFKDKIKKVKVDKGAVKPISNGANLMVPGIKESDEFNEDDIVKVLFKETPIAIGKTLMDSEEISSKNSGIGIENIHHIKDYFWDYKLN